ncbi:hypothetical protein P154DRAFT_290909 [Amniculicola lignicola CBS 123094]|uniref:Uncharacterized protein n=1 Tax=Amniculicola lignicola CBS 123094 TaxID=1392246 RepID=A0A6A5WW85_9PLEO|nr:hypothetical protein P154DRAFT_290909 [Amniculicola lignicola CBS 123094]
MVRTRSGREPPAPAAAAAAPGPATSAAAAAAPAALTAAPAAAPATAPTTAPTAPGAAPKRKRNLRNYYAFEHDQPKSPLQALEDPPRKPRQVQRQQLPPYRRALLSSRRNWPVQTGRLLTSKQPFPRPFPLPLRLGLPIRLHLHLHLHLPLLRQKIPSPPPPPPLKPTLASLRASPPRQPPSAISCRQEHQLRSP